MDGKVRALILSAFMVACVALLPFTSSSNTSSVNPEPVCGADRNATWTVGLLYCDNSISDGYTLLSPMPSTSSYLIDNNGQEIHSWTSPGSYRPGLSAYILPDGDLLRTANLAQEAIGDFSGGGIAGKIERISWEGELEWSWEYSSSSYITHHDIEPMPNGNILAIAWEDKSENEALQAGRNPEIASDAPGGTANVWPDHIIEIQPIGNSEANIVWQWNAWDHLVQDYDPSKENYGVIGQHPELLDINFIGATGNQAGRADWMHCNGIDYNSQLDQIALSCKNMNEIYILDHSTTTEEAASHSGGASGKGGDILYRWGNPQTYDAGLSSDQQLFSQHDVQWIEQGHPDEGKLILFNNGVGRSGTYSSVDVLETPWNNGSYLPMSNGTWGPLSPTWSWDIGEEMYAASISGAQRLENGNTLVTYGTQGTLYEVNESGSIVWTYINPVINQGPLVQGDQLPDGNRVGTTANQMFKSHRYTPDFAGFVDKNMTPSDYIEQWTDLCPSEISLPWDVNGDGCIDDTDQDGVNDPNDVCNGFDDSLDVDQDAIPDGCDDFIDTDGDGIVNSNDECEGFDDAVDQDKDAVPDGCDPIIDSDNDGVDDEFDLCEGFDDQEDNDDDGIPNGCDASPFGDQDEDDNETENATQEVDTPIDTNNESASGNLSEQIMNETNTSQNTFDDEEIAQLVSSESGFGGNVKRISSFILIFSGAWLALYVIAHALWGGGGSPEEKKPSTILEGGIQDYSDSFTDTKPIIDIPQITPTASAVTPMIDLPKIQQLQEVESPAVKAQTPPMPVEGLPQGWTEEQWQYYGQQWLDSQQGN